MSFAEIKTWFMNLICSEQPAKSSRMPMMITHDMRRRLKLSGCSENEIRNMTPSQAWQRLGLTVIEVVVMLIILSIIAILTVGGIAHNEDKHRKNQEKQERLASYCPIKVVSAETSFFREPWYLVRGKTSRGEQIVLDVYCGGTMAPLAGEYIWVQVNMYDDSIVRVFPENEGVIRER